MVTARGFGSTLRLARLACHFSAARAVLYIVPSIFCLIDILNCHSGQWLAGGVNEERELWPLVERVERRRYTSFLRQLASLVDQDTISPHLIPRRTTLVFLFATAKQFHMRVGR